MLFLECLLINEFVEKDKFLDFKELKIAVN